jgi:hypothetical protein
MKGQYVVVERVGEKFVLRSGNEKATVTNRLQPDLGPEPDTNNTWEKP